MFDWKVWLKLASELWNLRTKVNLMSKEVDDLRAAYAANKAEVQSDVAALQGKIEALTAQIAAMPGVTDDITALTQEITADTAALHASLNPAPAQ